MRKKRNLFFGTVTQNALKLVFIFGDRAVSVIEKSDVPQTIKDELTTARKYAEGRGVSVLIQSEADIEIVEQLVEITLAN